MAPLRERPALSVWEEAHRMKKERLNIATEASRTRDLQLDTRLDAVVGDALGH